jgi:hypothetical protein
MDRTTSLETLRAACEAAGLAWRGALHPHPDDGLPLLPDGRPVGTVVLLGLAGPRQWPAFAASPENRDGLADPLDRWSRRIVQELAPAGSMALFPFDGPPWLPFQRWAARAEPVHVSPLRILIHPHWGLWHSYRGALGLAGRIELTAAVPAPNPCETCRDRPCVSACPAAALKPEGFDSQACLRHVTSAAGAACRDGCLARQACPVGAGHRYGEAQIRFHMRAHLQAASIAA